MNHEDRSILRQQTWHLLHQGESFKFVFLFQKSMLACMYSLLEQIITLSYKH